MVVRRKGVEPEFGAPGGVGRVGGREIQVGGSRSQIWDNGFQIPRKMRRIVGCVAEIPATIPKLVIMPEAGMFGTKRFHSRRQRLAKATMGVRFRS